jgi:hypothetical protein
MLYQVLRQGRTQRPEVLTHVFNILCGRTRLSYDVAFARARCRGKSVSLVTSSPRGNEVYYRLPAWPDLMPPY